MFLLPVLYSSFLQGLFANANDKDADVRKNVCHAIVMMMEMRIAELLPHIHAVVEVWESVVHVCMYVLTSLTVIVDCPEWTSIVYPHVEISPSL